MPKGPPGKHLAPKTDYNKLGGNDAMRAGTRHSANTHQPVLPFPIRLEIGLKPILLNDCGVIPVVMFRSSFSSHLSALLLVLRPLRYPDIIRLIFSLCVLMVLHWLVIRIMLLRKGNMDKRLTWYTIHIQNEQIAPNGCK